MSFLSCYVWLCLLRHNLLFTSLMSSAAWYIFYVISVLLHLLRNFLHVRLHLTCYITFMLFSFSYIFYVVFLLTHRWQLVTSFCIVFLIVILCSSCSFMQCFGLLRRVMLYFVLLLVSFHLSFYRVTSFG